MNKSKKKNSVTKSAVKEKLKGFFDITAPSQRLLHLSFQYTKFRC